MTLDTSELEFGEILEQVVGLLSRRLPGDCVRLTQALLNYADDAVKLTLRGSVTIRARRQAETGQFARLFPAWPWTCACPEWTGWRPPAGFVACPATRVPRSWQ